MTKRTRSASNLVHADISFTSWQQTVPTVDEVRPKHCPNCGAPAHRPGLPRQLQGHGLRERQVRGPLTPDGAPQVIGLQVRRYRCSRCGSTCTVAPREIIKRRLYSRSAIGLAMLLYGVEARSQAEVRSRISPWRHVGAGASRRWATLNRWLRAIRDRRLLPYVRRIPAKFTCRAVAERVATTLAAMACPALRYSSFAEQVFSVSHLG